MAAHDSLHQAYKYGGATAGSAIGTVNGPGFDCRGMEEVLVILSVGIASGTLDVNVQQSSDDAVGDAYTNLAGASFTQVVDADDNKTYIGRIVVNKDSAGTGGVERWLRVVGIVGTAAVNYGACFVGAGLHDKPVAQEQTVAFNFDETAN